MGQDWRPERVRYSHIERLAERLSPRDWDILATLDRVRLATGIQLERLHFTSLTSQRSRAVKRWQVLKSLVGNRALMPLERRVGTSLHGSAQLHYVLDSAGQRLNRLRTGREVPGGIRRPRTVGERFVAHTRAVTELYVSLVERSRDGGFVVGDFLAEGDAYWPNGLGGWLRPDAFIRLDLNKVAADYWWYEAELAIKSKPAIERRCRGYLDFMQRGQLGPDGIVPRIMFGVENARQEAAIQSVVHSLPAPADALFRVVALPAVADLMIEELIKPDGGKS
jgi:hypothetical protein